MHVVMGWRLKESLGFAGIQPALMASGVQAQALPYPQNLLLVGLGFKGPE